MNAKSQVLSVFALLLAVPVGAEDKITLAPSRIEFLETDIRKLLKDGEMQRVDSEDIVYFAFGRKIREDGNQDRGPKLVLAEKLGERGIVFRDGYAEVNFGVYYKEKASDKTAFYITGQAKLTIGDDLSLIPEVVDKSIALDGANLGSNLVVSGNDALVKLGLGGKDIKRLYGKKSPVYAAFRRSLGYLKVGCWCSVSGL